MNKQDTGLKYPKNVVKALQSNYNYKFKLKDGEIVRKIDKAKIIGIW